MYILQEILKNQNAFEFNLFNNKLELNLKIKKSFNFN